MKANQRIVRFACRGTRHWMDHVPPRSEWRRPDSDTWRRAWAVLHYECQRPGCEVWRHDAIDSSGYLAARFYDYPDWYNMTEDERPSTEELRLWMLAQQDVAGRKKAS